MISLEGLLVPALARKELDLLVNEQLCPGLVKGWYNQPWKVP